MFHAFKLTLEETREADLLLHVADASDPQLISKISIVRTVLSEIGASEQPRLLVLNKSDLLTEERRQELRVAYPEAVLVSARTGAGLDEIARAADSALAARSVQINIIVPYAEAGVLEQIYEVTRDVDRDDCEDGVHVSARVPVVMAARLKGYAESSL